MLPFSHQQFMLAFSIYNGAVWPLQLVVHAFGVLMLVLLLRPSRRSDAANLIVVAAMWIWTGAVYHIGFFSRINPVAVVFGGLFVVQGLLLLRAVSNGTVAFGTARGLPRTLGWSFLAYSILLYPAIGFLSGAHYLDLPAFGVTPCPVTLTTFGLLLLAWPAPRHLFFIPVAWALVGGSAAWLLRMPQDWPLLLAPMSIAAVVVANRVGKRTRALPASMPHQSHRAT